MALAGEPEAIDVKPGKGLSLDGGPKHTMTYFEPKDGGCGLASVWRLRKAEVTGIETPGTVLASLSPPGFGPADRHHGLLIPRHLNARPKGTICTLRCSRANASEG